MSPSYGAGKNCDRPSTPPAFAWVTVSTDTPGELRVGRGMHGLQATMLADPKLAVVEQFGFRNQNLNNFRMPGRPGLPVPTSLLIDEEGRVVWKDQSDNYTQRSDPTVVGAALADSFPQRGS